MKEIKTISDQIRKVLLILETWDFKRSANTITHAHIKENKPAL